MIFNEVYGCYYNAVAKIIGLATEEKLNEKKLQEIAAEYAFEESVLTILPAIKNQEWQLIDSDFRTPILESPAMPMTELEIRWLKTILADPKIKLFQVPMDGLEEIEPLFVPEDIVYFDRYQDGDDYTDPAYIDHFHLIRQAVREHKKLRISFYNRKDQECFRVVSPIRLEYSDKDDKFRVLCVKRKDIYFINLGRIIKVEKMEESIPANLELPVRQKEKLICEIRDERNALERVLMKFAHYKKEAERISEKVYRLEMEYDIDDETDVLIQIRSFGSYVKVLAPERMKEEIRERLLKQINLRQS